MSGNEVSPVVWRALTVTEAEEYRESARTTYVPGSNVNIMWHPVYLHECYLINLRNGVLKYE